MSTETKSNPNPNPELAAAQQRIAELEGKLSGVDAAERAILKKMSQGLSREQAIAALKRQSEFPAAVKKVTEQNREANKKKAK